MYTCIHMYTYVYNCTKKMVYNQKTDYVADNLFETDKV